MRYEFTALVAYLAVMAAVIAVLQALMPPGTAQQLSAAAAQYLAGVALACRPAGRAQCSGSLGTPQDEEPRRAAPGTMPAAGGPGTASRREDGER